jgi:hypothetical protein
VAAHHRTCPASRRRRGSQPRHRLEGRRKLLALLNKRDQSDDIAEGASGQPDPRRGEIDGPAGSGGVIVEKLDQVEQPALGVDDETDYVEEVFDPGDYDGVDDAM